MKRAIMTNRFIFTVVMIAIFRILDLLPVMIRFALVENGRIDFGYDVVGIYELVGISMFALIIQMLPVIPFSGQFCDDQKQNYLLYALMRKGKTHYCVMMVISCAVSSFLCVFAGELIAIGLLSIVMVFNHGDVLSNVDAVSRMLCSMILLGLRGGFYGVITMLLSVFTLNKFVVYSVPVILHFFFMYFGIDYLKIPDKFNPTLVFNYYILGSDKVVESLIYAFVYLAVVIFIVERAMEKRIERCY